MCHFWQQLPTTSSKNVLSSIVTPQVCISHLAHSAKQSTAPLEGKNKHFAMRGKKKKKYILQLSTINDLFSNPAFGVNEQPLTKLSAVTQRSLYMLFVASTAFRFSSVLSTILLTTDNLSFYYFAQKQCMLNQIPLTLTPVRKELSNKDR